MLETGCGVGAPAGDNRCNDYAQGLALAYARVAEARGEAVVYADDAVLVDGASPTLFCNGAFVRRPLSEAGWAALVERCTLFFGERPGGPFLIWSAWPTPDLSPATLPNSPLALVGHPPLMFRPPGPAAVEPIAGFHIRPVADAASAEDWERVMAYGFPIPELQADPFPAGTFLPPAAVGTTGWRYWVGYLDGEPVATAAAWVTDHHVDVESIATLPAARGRGIGRAMTATATLAAPDRPAMLIASDLGRPVYERLGYTALLRFTMWEGSRPRSGP